MSVDQWTTAQKLYAQGFSALDIAEDLGIDVKEMWRDLARLKALKSRRRA
jgi:uncharacterized protein YjcR